MRELLRRIGGATPATVRVMVLVALSVAMMLVDHRTQQLEKMRNVLHTIVYPIVFISTIPREVLRGISGSLESSSNLKADNEALRQENLLLRSRLEKLHSLEADNRRLKRLLGQSEQIGGHVLLAGWPGRNRPPRLASQGGACGGGGLLGGLSAPSQCAQPSPLRLPHPAQAPVHHPAL